jgi:hypothetical protein
MSESFLARWSRRKRELTLAQDATPPPERVGAEPEQTAENAGAELPKGRDAALATSEPPVPPFDPASLPAIDSITAETDIRAFLSDGVPADLTRAALRRAWTSDPAIRDFVGPADYDWDFNAPGAAPGFGPIEASEDLRREVARLIGSTNAEQIAPDERAKTLPNDASDCRPESGASSAVSGGEYPDPVRNRDQPQQPVDHPSCSAARNGEIRGS